MKKFLLLVSVICLLGIAQLASAGEVGHYAPGIANPRDFVVPAPGFYYLQYNPYYSTDTYANDHGNKVKSLEASRTVNIGGRFPVTVTASADVSLNVKAAGAQPVFALVTKKKLLGADYAMLIAPYVGYTSVEFKGKITGIAIDGIKIRHFKGNELEIKQSASGFGDLYVQPLWIGWHGKKYDISLGYGFFAPTGGYDINKLANMGMGFWSHEVKLGGLYYVDKQKATALMANVTYEYNGKKDGEDIHPGQNVILEYGLSQYLSEWLEVGISGFGTFQVTENTGSDAMLKSFTSVNQGAGMYAGFWAIKNKLYISGKYLREFYSKNHTKGGWGALEVVYAF